MLDKTVLVALVAALVGYSLPAQLAAQELVPDYVEGKYPAPKYPDLEQLLEAGGLTEIARRLVNNPSRRDPHLPGYEIKPGNKVLIVAASHFDQRILDAFMEVIREAGGKPDLWLRDAPPLHPWDGWMEVVNPILAVGGEGREKTFQEIAAAGMVGKYDLVIYGDGGPIPPTPFRWEYMHWDRVSKFVTGAPDFPWAVRNLVEQKLWADFKNARRIRVTDPEGTDLSWSIKPEYFDTIAEYWPGYDIVMKGHISLTPLFFTPQGHDAEGVLAGTINHSGAFPYIKVFIKDARVQRIEGGGQYGELWREFLKKYENIQFPGYPGKGAGFLVEAALGTQPKIARVPGTLLDERMTWERLRSGVIHFGLGLTIAPGSPYLAEFAQLVQNQGIISGHFHVHTNFTTIDFTMADGAVKRIAENGHLTVFDDPEVRAVAAEYGDPDEVLAQVWVPEVPGINVPGDYMKDYASDPSAFILEEMRRYYDEEFIPEVDHPSASP